jgi:hypothetical protein
MSDEKKVSKQKVEPNEYPSWKYGPGGEGQIFNSPDDVPEGWVDHPKNALPAIDL